MATYRGNYLNMLNGHMDLYDGEGNPKVPKVESDLTADSVADMRQIMSNMVGRGHKNLKDESINGDFAALVNTVGVSKARKLMDQAIIYNQRPEVKNMSIENKVQSFFDMGSSDKDVNTLLQKARSFGDGVVAGMNRSPSVENMKLTNRFDALAETDKGDALFTDVNKKMK